MIPILEGALRQFLKTILYQAVCVRMCMLVCYLMNIY